jgi:hypothetical protein
MRPKMNRHPCRKREMKRRRKERKRLKKGKKNP